MTREQQTVLKNLALKNPEDYLDELQSRMIALGLPKIHTSTIYVYLKSVGLSLNNLTRIAKERSEVERAAFYKHIEGLDPHMFIFMDETAKDRKAARRRRGWVETLLAAMVLYQQHVYESRSLQRKYRFRFFFTLSNNMFNTLYGKVC